MTKVTTTIGLAREAMSRDQFYEARMEYNVFQQRLLNAWNAYVDTHGITDKEIVSISPDTHQIVFYARDTYDYASEERFRYVIPTDSFIKHHDDMVRDIEARYNSEIQEKIRVLEAEIAVLKGRVK